MRLTVSKNTMLLIVTAGVTILLAGCDGCDVTGSATSAPPTPDEFAGDWVVESYAADDTGCEPTGGSPPFAHLKISAVIEVDDGGPPRLDLLPCVSADACAGVVAPENELPWNSEHLRAEAVHHTASLTQTDPLQTQCRLSTVRTLLLPDDSTLELVRSHYDLDLPIEGDEACNTDLAAQYHAQMECTQSERFEFRRAEPGDDPAPTS